MLYIDPKKTAFLVIHSPFGDRGKSARADHRAKKPKSVTRKPKKKP